MAGLSAGVGADCGEAQVVDRGHLPLPTLGPVGSLVEYSSVADCARITRRTSAAGGGAAGGRPVVEQNAAEDTADRQGVRFVLAPSLDHHLGASSEVTLAYFLLEGVFLNLLRCLLATRDEGMRNEEGRLTNPRSR